MGIYNLRFAYHSAYAIQLFYIAVSVGLCSVAGYATHMRFCPRSVMVSSFYPIPSMDVCIFSPIRVRMPPIPQGFRSGMGFSAFRPPVGQKRSCWRLPCRN